MLIITLCSVSSFLMILRALRKKYTPETSCLPQPHEVCGPEGFTMEPVSDSCHDDCD